MATLLENAFLSERKETFSLFFFSPFHEKKEVRSGVRALVITIILTKRAFSLKIS